METEIETTTIDETPTNETEVIEETPIEGEETITANEEVVTPTEEEDVAPAYTPNLEYKVYGKTQKIEDEWVTGLVNQDNEENFRKLYERAGGFDQLKTNYKEMETTHQTLQNNYYELNTVRNDLVGAVESGNLHKAMEILDIKEQDLFKYVQGRLDYHSMPQDQKQVYDARYEAERQNSVLAQTNAQLAQQKNEIFMQQHNFEMSQALSTPEIADFVTKYNQAKGDDNAFINYANRIGEGVFHSQKRHLPAMECVKQAMSELSWGMPQETQAQAQPTATAQVEAPKAPPVLNGSSSASIVKKKPTSIEELEKEYASLYEN